MAVTPLGYYEWYPRDFYTSIVVRSMSFTARSIYRELLDIQWENGCLTDVQRLLNVMGVTAEQWNEFAPFIDELFPNGVNNRLNLLREKAFQSQEKKAAAGRASAQKRLEFNTSSTPVQQVFNQTETETETTTETNKKKQGNKLPIGIPPLREEVIGKMKELGFLDPEFEATKFFDYWEGLSWHRGKEPMKNWRSSCNTWKTNSVSRGEFPGLAPSLPSTSPYGEGFGTDWGFDPDTKQKEAYTERGRKLIAGVAA